MYKPTLSERMIQKKELASKSEAVGKMKGTKGKDGNKRGWREEGERKESETRKRRKEGWWMF